MSVKTIQPVKTIQSNSTDTENINKTQFCPTPHIWIWAQWYALSPMTPMLSSVYANCFFLWMTTETRSRSTLELSWNLWMNLLGSNSGLGPIRGTVQYGRSLLTKVFSPLPFTRLVYLVLLVQKKDNWVYTVWAYRPTSTLHCIYFRPCIYNICVSFF